MNTAKTQSAPYAVNVHVGSRVRIRRILLGMKLELLSKCLGVTSHEMEEYERGEVAISARELYRLSRILDVPISFFFDDMTEEAHASERFVH